jgi:hypothetical protein
MTAAGFQGLSRLSDAPSFFIRRELVAIERPPSVRHL